SLLRRSPLSAFLFYFLGPHRALPSFPTRRSSDLTHVALRRPDLLRGLVLVEPGLPPAALLPGSPDGERFAAVRSERTRRLTEMRSEEHTSELQSLTNLVCRLLLEKKKRHTNRTNP